MSVESPGVSAAQKRATSAIFPNISLTTAHTLVAKGWGVTAEDASLVFP